jgi:16S rRNA (cytidine1402-2'-O)-methyltransferase
LSDGNAQGLLSVVATPIGNLQDVTLRALEVLRAAHRILAEDTRRTRTLCERHGIGTPVRSFHAHTDTETLTKLIEELATGARFALVTDAGTPVVSDPGARLVSAARDAGVVVESIPGPSAVTAAVAVCGLRCDTFRFLGFLPKSGSRRKQLLQSMASDHDSTVLFESPNRVSRTLLDLTTSLGKDRRAAVCRELTKMHEEVARGTLQELSLRFADGARGEITIVIEGRDRAQREGSMDPESLDETIRMRLERGQSARDVARELSDDLGLARREVYQRVVELRDQSSAEEDGSGG